MRPELARRIGRLGARLVLATALFVSGSAKAQEDLPRPPRLMDLMPRNVFSLQTEYGYTQQTANLAFPIGLSYHIAPEVVFDVDIPFAYANRPGEISTPIVGNVGAGVRLLRRARLTVLTDLRYGLSIAGRAPTAPSASLEGNGVEAARLRLITPYYGERWTPASAAVRADGAAGIDFGTFTLEGAIGVVGTLPIDARPASASLHYGLVGGFRAFSGAWLLVELAGAELVPGMPGAPRGHVLTIAPVLRFDLGGVAPAVWVSFPVVDTAQDVPLTIGIELAAY